ncbi:hypothetical protein BDN72DRAFT_832412 [Pluteus cervinus]|uniref:Uncharacterized protein n=1 Tax=Pluteus cervinus TaxID=181527 RepID=A0ACD3BAN1_9AGAR|nr:hypothetical protein BDN72DRAFT_832412 [Pluteus cervinus]
MAFADHKHWLYVWIPLFGAFIWFSTLLSMLITWLATGRQKYPSQEGSIAYISDVGASYLKPLFIAGSSITAVSFFLSLSIERWLRHSRRLPPNMAMREKVFSILAIIGSAAGGAGLILLSVFDTLHYTRLHRGFLLLFMLGVALSAIFTVIEYRWISKDFREYSSLRGAYIAKGIIAGILIALAIAFAVALYKSPDVGAVLEWTIAFGFTLYLATFVYDLRLTKATYKRQFASTIPMRDI